MNKYIFIILVLIVFSSCGKPQKEFDTVINSYWGHLEQVDKSSSTKLFFAHLKDQTEVNICLSQEMSNKLKGVEEEIKASVNIWGHYIGRKLKVNVVTRDLLNQHEQNDLNKLTEKNYGLCPSNTDLVVGFAQDKLESTWIGITTYTYFTKKPPKQNEIDRYKRGLYLRLGASSVEKNGYSWSSLSTHFSRSYNEDEILKLLVDRKSKVFLPQTDKKISLRVLVHEFGHVWGLCDQYFLDSANKTNCDESYSSIGSDGKVHIHEESTMSSSGWVSKLYLSDDDIMGIRELAERNFGENYDQNKVESIPILSENNEKLEYLTFIESQVIDGDLKLIFALKTSIDLNLHLSFYNEIKNKWFVYNPKILWKGPGEWNHFTWSFKLDQIEEIKKFKMIVSSPELKQDTVIINNI